MIYLISHKTIYCQVLVTYNKQNIQIIIESKSMQRPKKKKSQYQKMNFSDSQIEAEIEQDVRKIRDKNTSEIDKQQQIDNLYKSHKDKKKKREILFSEDAIQGYKASAKQYHLDQDDQEQGQVHQVNINTNKASTQPLVDDISINDLGDHIRPITLTRNKIQHQLNSPRFEELVKGCFVRYLSIKSSNSNNAYMIAQIVGITEGQKQYYLGTNKTKILLKLQETSQREINLAIQLISNKHPPGSLEILQWLKDNRNKMPKDTQLKQKLEQYNKLCGEHLSSEQIDDKIFKKAKKIAEKIEEPKEDIGYLVQFIKSKLHNLLMQYQQIIDEKGAYKGKQELQAIEKKRQQYKQIGAKLNEVINQRKKRAQTSNPQAQTNQQNQDKKHKINVTKKLMWQYSQKKEDEIYQNVKAKYALLSTYEGYTTIRNNTLKMHSNFQFPL